MRAEFVGWHGDGEAMLRAAPWRGATRKICRTPSRSRHGRRRRGHAMAPRVGTNSIGCAHSGRSRYPAVRALGLQHFVAKSRSPHSPFPGIVAPAGNMRRVGVGVVPVDDRRAVHQFKLSDRSRHAVPDADVRRHQRPRTSTPGRRRLLPQEYRVRPTCRVKATERNGAASGSYNSLRRPSHCLIRQSASASEGVVVRHFHRLGNGRKSGRRSSRATPARPASPRAKVNK